MFPLGIVTILQSGFRRLKVKIPSTLKNKKKWKTFFISYFYSIFKIPKIQSLIVYVHFKFGIWLNLIWIILYSNYIPGFPLIVFPNLCHGMKNENLLEDYIQKYIFVSYESNNIEI